eukprot:5533904-Pyramimonas_sp.AAC.2
MSLQNRSVRYPAKDEKDSPWSVGDVAPPMRKDSAYTCASPCVNIGLMKTPSIRITRSLTTNFSLTLRGLLPGRDPPPGDRLPGAPRSSLRSAGPEIRPG